MRTLHLKFTFLLVSISSISLFSQSKKMWVDDGDKAFKQRDYSNAIVNYLKVLDDTAAKSTKVLPYEVSFVNQKFKNDSTKKHKKDTLKKVAKVDTTHHHHHMQAALTDLKKHHLHEYTLFKLGEAYRLNEEDPKAISYLKQVVQSGKFPESRHFYALALMTERRYQDALDEFELFINSGSTNDSLIALAQRAQGGCYMGMDTLSYTKEMKVRMFDTLVFNRGNSSFGAAYDYNSEKVIFTSARKESTILDPKKEDPAYLCDLYWTERTDTTWSAPVNYRGPLNTNAHEAAATLSPDKIIYFTKWNNAMPDDVAIYKANAQGDRVFTPQKLGTNVNVSGFKSMHPSVSSDGKKLFFSSNRPGGKGGLDIWMINIDESGMLGEPKNCGAPVNTPGDEVTPFLHVISNQLYFSSNGHAGYGGLDIFSSDFNAEDGVFDLPKNVGAPLNSSKDDSYFIKEKIANKGIFSSDRAECPGGNCYKLYYFESQPIKFDVNGVVFDTKTNEPMGAALVTIKNVTNEEDIQYVPTDEKGYYTAELKAGGQYFIKAQKNKYLGDAASVITKDKTTTTHFDNTDLFLTPIPEGEIEIEGIEYDFNSAALRPVSMTSLDKIADLLILNDNLAVNIEANTDSRGNDAYNMKLSQARAQSCLEYLVSKGIALSRLLSKGNGETNPIIPESEIKKLVPKSPEFEAAHQKNRRTALRIVGETKINVINKGK